MCRWNSFFHNQRRGGELQLKFRAVGTAVKYYGFPGDDTMMMYLYLSLFSGIDGFALPPEYSGKPTGDPNTSQRFGNLRGDKDA